MTEEKNHLEAVDGLLLKPKRIIKGIEDQSSSDYLYEMGDGGGGGPGKKNDTS